MSNIIPVLFFILLISVSGCIKPSNITEQDTPFQQGPVITAPKIIVSYERQHAWLALKVSDVGNSNEYSHWNIRGSDYYFVEATIPKVVAPDNRMFLINDREYSSDEFYNVSVYVFDTPQDANDFQAGVSSLGGWNQEFTLKKGDLDKIMQLLGG